MYSINQDLAKQKEDLRQIMVQKLAACSKNPPEFLIKKENLISFLKTLQVFPPTPVAGYWPYSTELDFRPFFTHLYKAGFVCALPVIQSMTHCLSFATWTPQTTLMPGAQGTHVPQNFKDHIVRPEVIFAPLMAFDATGNRLGRGGGYFDATLKTYRTEKNSRLLALGVGFSWQECQQVPMGPQDEKIDGILTEKSLRLFNTHLLP